MTLGGRVGIDISGEAGVRQDYQPNTDETQTAWSDTTHQPEKPVDYLFM